MSGAMVLTLVAALVIGLTLGGLGGGGSILTVPVLVYLAGVGPKPAIAMSLVVVGVTAAVALIPHARAGRVHWRTGLLFGGFGMAGAYAPATPRNRSASWSTNMPPNPLPMG